MADNKTVSLSFSIGDLPMIAQAFSIARATAMCCGNKIAKHRLDNYTKMVEALIPPEAKIFDPEEWAEICASIATCKEYSVRISHIEGRWNRHNHYVTGGRIEIKVDNETWESDWLRYGNEYTTSSPEYLTIKAMMQEMAGLDSKEIEETDNVVAVA